MCPGKSKSLSIEPEKQEIIYGLSPVGQNVDVRCQGGICILSYQRVWEAQASVTTVPRCLDIARDLKALSRPGLHLVFC